MRYQRVVMRAMGYALAPNVVTSTALEQRLAPLYERLHLPAGQLAYLTGIRERRWWDAGFAVSDGAILAAERALDEAGVAASDLGALVYTGVCREQHEPATACRVGAELGVSADTVIFDLANACLGLLNGLLAVANMIELGHIRSGLVVACESAREINEQIIQDLLADPEMARFRLAMATLTGGSGAAAVLLTDGSFGPGGHRLVGGVARTAPEHHGLCRWGVDPATGSEYMRTDGVGVLRHGVALGRETWDAFKAELGWHQGSVDRVICHQVGQANKAAILDGLGLAAGQDFSTYESLGNMGTVSVPITAAIASERAFLSPGDRVGFLGIGSGLNCLMLGWEW